MRGNNLFWVGDKNSKNCRKWLIFYHFCFWWVGWGYKWEGRASNWLANASFEWHLIYQTWSRCSNFTIDTGSKIVISMIVFFFNFSFLTIEESPQRCNHPLMCCTTNMFSQNVYVLNIRNIRDLLTVTHIWKKKRTFTEDMIFEYSYTNAGKNIISRFTCIYTQ